jgi:hypothetical protein
MVAVVVDDGDAVHLADLGEAPVHPLEAGQRGADLVAFHAQMARHRDGGQRVRDVVVARHRQAAALDPAVLGLQRDVEMRDAVRIGQVFGPHIGLRVEAEGHHAAVGDAADQRLNLGVSVQQTARP